MNTSTDQSNQRHILPPHTLPADAPAYLAACSQEERTLVQLAIEQLGSSYFMEKSHGYLAWKQSCKK
jgi:hypothetical protein